MHVHALLLAAIGATLTITVSGRAADLPTPVGRTLAVSHCAYCHVVTPDQGFAPPLRPQGPGFASIANRDTFSQKRLSRFLMTTHRDVARGKNMPNPLLSSHDIDEVATFIASLRDPR